MAKTFFHSMLIILGCLSACQKEKEPEPEPPETCIEGWMTNTGSNEIYYESCPQSLEFCSKTFRISINVVGEWVGGPGTITVRNIENGVVEEFSKTQHIYSHRYQIKMTFAKSHKYTHEVTMELPSDACTINGQLRSYTYEVDIRCGTWKNLVFDICTE